MAAEFAARLPLAYSRNAANIGGDRNFEHLIRTTPGTYFWLIGDDDLLVEDVLPGLVALLRAQAPGLVVLDDLTDGPGAEEAARAKALPARSFANYTAFVDHHRKADVQALIAHSLISKNVVRRTSYDPVMHGEMLAGEDVYYAFMYALVAGLARSGESIQVPGWPAIVVRRVGAGGGIPPWVARRLWRRYYEWLGRRYGHPELPRHGRVLYGPRHQLRAWRKGVEALIKRGVRALTSRGRPA